MVFTPENWKTVKQCNWQLGKAVHIPLVYKIISISVKFSCGTKISLTATKETYQTKYKNVSKNKRLNL